MAGPLAGRRVLVTRAAHQAGKLSEGLRALGAEPVEVPVLELRPPENLQPLDSALRQIKKYDWLILTSANTVRAILERAAVLGIPLQSNGYRKLPLSARQRPRPRAKRVFRSRWSPKPTLPNPSLKAWLRS